MKIKDCFFLIFVVFGMISCSANHYVKGILYKDKGEYEQALHEFERVSPNHPIYPYAQKEIKVLERKIKPQEKIAKKRDKSEVKVKSKEEEYEEILGKGRNFKENGEILDAYIEFRRAQAILPNDPRATKETEEIEIEVDLILKENLKKAEKFLRQGKIREAVILFEKNLTARPNDKATNQLVHRLAVEAFNNSEYEKAIALFEAEFKANPSDKVAGQYLERSKKLLQGLGEGKQ